MNDFVREKERLAERIAIRMERLRLRVDAYMTPRILDPRFHKALEVACFERELRDERYALLREADRRFGTDSALLTGGCRVHHPDSVKERMRFIVNRENEASTDFWRFRPARVQKMTMRRLYNHVMYADYMHVPC